MNTYIEHMPRLSECLLTLVSWEETFCISAVECNGCWIYIVVTTNFGALYETCSEWPIYINYEK
jgi:hypothetical protein